MKWLSKKVLAGDVEDSKGCVSHLSVSMSIVAAKELRDAIDSAISAVAKEEKPGKSFGEHISLNLRRGLRHRSDRIGVEFGWIDPPLS